MAGRFSVEAIFKAVDRITRPVDRMQRRVQRFTRSMGDGLRNVNDRMGRVSDGIKRVGLVAVASLGLVSGAMGSVVSTGANFEQTLVNAAAKFPGEIRRGTEAFQALERAARETGSTTEFTASQAAEALNFLAMAGFDAESAISALPGVVNLATASQTDLATATDIATDALGAFNMLSKDAVTNQRNLARVSDVLAKTATTSNTSIEQLFEAMKKGGPVATAAGASIETVAAMLGTMANAGIKGERAGTAVANAFLNLTKPSTQTQKVIRALGISLQDTRGRLKDVPQLITEITKATSKLTTTQRQAVVEQLFGREGLAGNIAILNQGAEAFSAYRAQIENATGATTKMATTMRDTVQGRLNSLKSAVEGVAISIFSMNRGPLADVIDQMTMWVRANEGVIASGITNFIVGLVDNFDQIVRTGKQIAGVITVFYGLSAAVKVAQAAVIAFQAVMVVFTVVMGTAKAALWVFSATAAGLPKVLALVRAAVLALNIAMAANPVGLVVRAVASLIAVAAPLLLAWDPVAKFFEDLWGKIKDVVSGAQGALRRFGDFFGFTSPEPEAKVAPPPTPVIPAATLEEAVGRMMPRTTTRIIQPDIFPRQAANDSQAAPVQMVSPQERVARSIEERRSFESAEVTIRDETGKAERTKGQFGGTVRLKASGEF